MKAIRKLLPVIPVIVLCFSLVFSVAFTTPTFSADENNDAVSTTFFGDFKDDGKGCGVYLILNYALDILSWGIGSAAVVGIIVSGVLYLTAKGNENQVIKSKKRILEIVIGVAIYAVLYAGLNFLLPGGKLNTNVQCTATTVSSNYGHTNEWRTKVTDQNDGAKRIGSKDGGSSASDSFNVPAGSNAAKINASAKHIVWPKGTPKSKYKGNHSNGKGRYKNYVAAVKKMQKQGLPAKGHGFTRTPDCGKWVTAVVWYAGVDGKKYIPSEQYGKKHPEKWSVVKLGKRAYPKDLAAGDVLVFRGSNGAYHGAVVVNIGNNLYITEASYTLKLWGHVGGKITSKGYKYPGRTIWRIRAKG